MKPSELNKDNTAISVTAYTGNTELAVVLRSIQRANRKDFPIFVYVDFENLQQQNRVSDLCIRLGISHERIIYNSVNLGSTGNKLKSLYDLLNTPSIEYIFAFDADMEVGVNYFHALESLYLSTDADIVNSINYGHLSDKYIGLYGEMLTYWWQFLASREVLDKLKPYFNHYQIIFNEKDAASFPAAITYFREVINAAEFKTSGADFRAICNTIEVPVWDAAIQWFLKAIGGCKYTTLTTYCRPLRRQGTYVQAEEIEEGLKYLSKIDNTYQTKWELWPEFREEKETLSYACL